MRIVDFFDGFSSATDPSSSVGLSDATRESAPDIGVVDGVNDEFTLTYVPLTENHFQVAVDGLVLKNSEFSLAGSILTLSTPPALDQDVTVWYFHSGTVASSGASGTWNVEYFTLDSTDVDVNKYVTLSNTPNVALDVVLDVIGGTSQEYSTDFIVVGSQLSWNGLALDGDLILGDRIRVIYISA